MLQFAKKLIRMALVAAGATQAWAFSLTGPLATWQTVDLGYGLETTVIASTPETTGPMNVGEEYRLNMPVIVYGFDPSFVEYFGQNGIDAVEAAFKILNDLPPASQMSPDLREFPLDTRRYNYQAVALRVRDLKSWTLSALMEVIGLGVPERSIFTLRGRTLVNNTPVYVTVRRNFDPVTLAPSSYVNGTLFTYSIFQTYFTPPADVWEAVPISVDPFEATPSSVAAYVGMMGGTGDPRGTALFFNPGLFYTGLTRDDVGGIRYLLRKTNLNVENVASNSIAAFSSGGLSSGTISGGGLPWAIVNDPNSAQAATGAGTGVGGAAPGGGAVGGGGTNVLVDVALRPGPDRINFVRADFDSLLGQFFTNNVVFADTYLTNGFVRQQLLQRILAQPDILFSAADLGLDPDGNPYLFDRTIAFQNNEALNSAPGGTVLDGPGVVSLPIELTFSKIGPWFLNIGDGDETLGSRGTVWGSFDSSTNAPILFPASLSVRELERLLFQQGGGGSPWQIP